MYIDQMSSKIISAKMRCVSLNEFNELSERKQNQVTYGVKWYSLKTMGGGGCLTQPSFYILHKIYQN